MAGTTDREHSIERLPGLGRGARRHGRSDRFAELCAKTHFSLLEGASSPREMLEQARELDLFAIAIADRNGIYGSVRAFEAARRVEQSYIVGAELPVRLARLEPAGRARSTLAVVLLVQHRAGYTNLCRVLTRAHADLPRERAELDPEVLARHAEGLVAIVVPESTDVSGEGGEAELAHVDPAVWSAFDGRAFIATFRHHAPEDRYRETSAKRWSERLGLPLVATARPLMHHPARKPIADVLFCIREKTTLDEAATRLGANTEAYLRSAEEMARIFRDAPERLARTVEIARSCRFSLDELEYSFPYDGLLPGETADQALRRLCAEGVVRRYPNGAPPAVAEQIEKELRLIEKLQKAPFFLSVFEIVQIARKKGILCQGRGSAANSAVCYVLGITAVDPARSNLLFERFLSEERNEPPDIDVDFEHERREEVIAAIYEKYGRERAAMVSEVISYRGRSALREAGKAFGLSLEQTGRLAATVGAYDGVGAVTEQKLREVGLDSSDRRIRRTMAVAAELQGFPRHMSTHVGGFVLSADPLDEIAPVEPAKMPGRTVVPWDKDDIDLLGFFKVDVLGLGMLTAIRKTLELVHQSEAGPSGLLPLRAASHHLLPEQGAPEAPERLPANGATDFDPIEALARISGQEEDERVYEAICRADTIGVFQIESRAQMAMLPRLRPKEFYDLVIEVAIVRPGPIQGGMVHPYLRRRAGEEPVVMPHPSLTPILKRTLGVPLFQEQVMQIAIEGAGYKPGEADGLRRDMAAWRREDRLSRHREKLLRGFAEHGLPREFAERLFEQIKGFGEYGFPESHAASFALLVYASAWLKVYHPAHFACALLNSQPMGFYSPSSIVQDAQRHGVAVLGPDVSHSEWDSSLEWTKPAILVAPPPRPKEQSEIDPAASRTGRPALRLGLRLVKGIGEVVARKIMDARRRALLRDVEDLACRADLPAHVLDKLAAAGALASLERERRHAMWKARTPRSGDLFEKVSLGEPEAALPPLGKLDALRFDYETIGLSVQDHPMRHLRKAMRARNVSTSVELPRRSHGSNVRVAGLVITRQRPATASGVVFVTLEDETGVINMVLTNEVFERYRLVAAGARLVLAHGRLERTPQRSEDDGERTPVIHVLVRSLEPLSLPGGIESRSRDFR